MRTIESQAHFMARTALVGSSSFKGCLQRSEACINKPDLRASESLTQLKLTAEKMIQEQASVKIDLQVTYSKLEKSEQEVRSLETRLQDTKNENFVLRMKQQEALKLWESLESKFSSTRTFCNQLMETLQHLAVQVHEAEQGKQALEEKLAERLTFHQEIKLQVDDLLLKKQNSERIAANWETEYGELENLQKQFQNTLAEETTRSRQLQAEKAEMETHLRTSKELLQEERERLESAEMQLDQLRNEVEMKSNELEKMHAELANAKKQYQALEDRFASLRNRNNELQQELETVALKTNELEVANAVAKDTVNELLAAMENCKELAELERRAKEDTWEKLKSLELEYRELVNSKAALEKHVNDLEEELQVLKDEHETSRRRSTGILQEFKEELDFARQEVDDLAEEKLKLVRLSQDLELKLSELSETAKDLTSRRDQLVTENAALLLEIKVANENMEHSVEEKMCEIEKLSRKNVKDREALAAQEAEISLLRHSLSEKDQLIGGLIDEQKGLKSQYLEAIDQKVSAERLSHEIRRQAETQLDTKLMELNKHIKEISERNDEEMKEITRKCESETKEAIRKEEQKAATLLVAMREECELKISKAQELSFLNQKILGEHQAQMREMMQKHEAEKRLLVSQHQAELNRQLEEEKRKWVEELVIKMNELEKKHAEEIKKLSSDNSFTRSKADDRVLRLEQQLNVLQEQLKEEKFKRQEDLKAATRKYEGAVHTFEADRKVYEENCKQLTLNMEAALKKELEETKQKLAVWEEKCKSLERNDSMTKLMKNQSIQGQPNLLANQTYPTAVQGAHAVPCLTEGKKIESPVEKGKCESHTLPTHSKTVTHHEYEVATSDGRKTITRKRTKSTVMFESPLDVKRMGNRKSTRISSQPRKAKPSRVYATTMGDLFGGKSLDPYSDDPYAFN